MAFRTTIGHANTSHHSPSIGIISHIIKQCPQDLETDYNFSAVKLNSRRTFLYDFSSLFFYQSLYTDHSLHITTFPNLEYRIFNKEMIQDWRDEQ